MHWKFYPILQVSAVKRLKVISFFMMIIVLLSICFFVCCGFDSMALGEDEILGQVKKHLNFHKIIILTECLYYKQRKTRFYYAAYFLSPFSPSCSSSISLSTSSQCSMIISAAKQINSYSAWVYSFMFILLPPKSLYNYVDGNGGLQHRFANFF